MKLEELKQVTPPPATQAELEESCTIIIQDMFDILAQADARVEKEKNANTNRE